MTAIRNGWGALLLMAAALMGCGGGGGSSPSTPSQPGGTSSGLRFMGTNLHEASVAVTLTKESSWVFDFDTPIAAESAAAFVEMRSAGGVVPVRVAVYGGTLQVRAAEDLRLRTDYTLTIKAGLKASSGATLAADVVRHFRTVLFDGFSRTVQPGNYALGNYSGQRTVRIGDLNGDGRPDIVQIGGDHELLYKLNSFAINIFRQNADHTFTRSQNLLVHDEFASVGVSNRMGEIAIVDLDQDGVPEIVAGIRRPYPGPSGLMVFKQDQQGRYAESGLIPTSFVARLTVVDIDHDGKLDLLALGDGAASTDGLYGCGLVAVLSSPKGPRLQPSSSLPCGLYESVVGSLERPGQLELVMLDTVPGVLDRPPVGTRFQVYTLDGQGRPIPSEKQTSAMAQVCAGLPDCSGLMLMDINGDGQQDLLFRNAVVPDGRATSLVFVRDSSGLYREYVRQNFGDGARAFMVTDVDRDGRDDIVVIVQTAGGSGVAYARSKSAPGLELSHIIPIDCSDTMNQATVAVADLDGDGLPDVLTDSYNTGLSVLFQRAR